MHSIFTCFAEKGIQLKIINLGDGFPAQYSELCNTIATYAKEILRFIHDDFHDDLSELILEPGRSLVEEAGVIVTEAVLVSKKAKNNLYRRVFNDIGKFSGMIETLGEAIRYLLLVETVIIAGPTCGSMDILYENYKSRLPLSLRPRDRLYWFATKTYMTSYSSVEFNGFPPLRAYHL